MTMMNQHKIPLCNHVPEDQNMNSGQVTKMSNIPNSNMKPVISLVIRALASIKSSMSLDKI